MNRAIVTVGPVPITHIDGVVYQAMDAGWEVMHIMFAGTSQPKIALSGQAPHIPMFGIMVSKSYAEGEKLLPPAFDISKTYSGFPAMPNVMQSGATAGEDKK